MTRPAQVIINLSALRHNFSRVQSLAPNSRIISVVKADAYGHGLVRVAKSLSQSDAFGVSSKEEATELRDAGIDKPIVLLEGIYSSDEMIDIESLRLDVVVHHEQQVRMIEKSNIKSPVRVWLKIDSGMHRLGFAPGEAKDIHQRLVECDKVYADILLMTHLADAGDPNSSMTTTQLKVFNEVCEGLSGSRSIANSAGILAWQDSHADFVRPGLMLYGISPINNTVAADHNLQPVMTMQSNLISIKNINKGESVGYGADWICPEDMNVGIVAAGYADGYPRHGNSGTPIIINGLRSQVIGNPSMDMITVDLRNIADAKVGDPVELWGNQLAVEEVAYHASTIPYELISSVHKRLKVVIND